MADMTKEELLLAKRFLDLSRQAEQKDIVVFSEFLNLNELNIFKQEIPNLYSGFEISGGYELSERQMIAFIPDALCYAWDFQTGNRIIPGITKSIRYKCYHLTLFVMPGIIRLPV